MAASRFRHDDNPFLDHERVVAIPPPRPGRRGVYGPLSEIVEAHRYVDSLDRLGKVVVLLSDIPNRPYLDFEWPSRA